MKPTRVPFLDLTRQDRELREELCGAFNSFLQRGRHILGPEVESLEAELAAFCGVEHGVGVASGTDALILTLRALGIGEGDEVILPAFTAPPTAVAVTLSGAVPVFADVDPHTLTLDPASVAERITHRTRCLLPVHLYGRPADMAALGRLARQHGLHLVEDCAQSHGAALDGRITGSFGTAGCFSFYPTKNLGAYGDGGMVVTSSGELAQELRCLRDYGRVDRDLLGKVGTNSRLDELQAALLRIKLRRLPEWNRRRRELARIYLDALSDLPLGLPECREGEEHVYHIFAVTSERRDELRRHLELEGVETVVHYPLPVHLQPPFRSRPGPPCPVAEEASRRVLSLPLYPHLTTEEQETVIEAVRSFFGAS
ncbi:DegT/DnrJ/EryC1/StrS family aminotransferase [Candidatus Solincola tengchongensis]|uniref:DegT/DnrJ/EryC1/StrS family aminotransferase n=1 Tax=Candidatus Solincola tengchongensis TaxID=2900693 RepID=UPI0025800B68|nr:DegT/DnrJ/EryC1/StrS family aminotransferase [Candidatus Solincola tengchongensis]